MAHGFSRSGNKGMATSGSTRVGLGASRFRETTGGMSRCFPATPGILTFLRAMMLVITTAWLIMVEVTWM